MRTFFCFFFLLYTALCAQDTASLEKFRSDYEVIKKEIADAKNRTISVDNNWIATHNQELFRLDGARQLLLKNESAAVREEVSGMEIKSLFDDMFYVNKRRYVEHGVARWNLKFAQRQLGELAMVVQQFETGGLRFDFQVQQAFRTYVLLEYTAAILEDKEFSSRVCGDQSECRGEIEAARERIFELLPKAKQWAEKAKDWKNPG